MKKDHDFNSIFRAMPLPCLVLKPEERGFRVVDANSGYLEMIGAKREELVGKKACEAFPRNPEQEQDSVPILGESLRKVVATGKEDQIDLLRYDIRNAETGQFIEKHWSPQNIPVVGADGQVAYILHILRDRTNDVAKQQKLKEEVERTQQKYRHFVDNNPDGLYSMDGEGNFISANQGLANMAEVSLPELLKMNFIPFCHPEDREKVKLHSQMAMEGKATKFEARFVSAKGRNVVLGIHLLPMNVNGRIEGAYGIAKDITEIRESQKVIVERKNFLQANASFISSLLENELEDESLEEAFGIIGETVMVDRMYYFSASARQDSDEIYISQKIEWTSEKASAQIDNPELQEMPLGRLHQMMGQLSKNQPFTAVLSELEDGEMREIFLDEDIKSMLVLPIFLKKRLYGFIGFDDCTRERQWSEEEVTFLQNLTHNFTTAMEKRLTQKELQEREETLKMSEKKFKALVQEGSDLIAVFDLKGNYQFVSETSTGVLGIPPEGFLGKHAFDFVHPEDKRRFIEIFPTLKNNKKTKIGAFRFRGKDNNWRWLETTVTNLIDDPAVGGLVSNSRDITTIMDQAREIEHINERYRLAASATQDLIYDWDVVSDKVERFHQKDSFLGYPVREVDQRSFWRQHIHPEEYEALRQHQKEVLANPDKNFINTQYRFKRADGSYAHFIDRAYIIRDADGKVIRMVGASSDISDLVSRKEALKVANKRFKMAMKATNEMIWEWDIASDRVERSKAFGKIYGYKSYRNNPQKDYWLDKIHNEEIGRVRDSLYAALEDPSQKKWREEYRFIKSNGEMAHVIDRGYILRDKAGKAVRMVGAVLDVTASQRALRKIEAQNQILKEIAWEQSHVVRAPLARLQGLLQLLEMESVEEMGHDEILSHIKASAAELDVIVRKIVIRTEGIEDISE